LTEPELIRRAKAGDRQAMTELLSVHATQAYRLGLNITHNKADAEDAVQNAFVKAFTNLNRFDESRPFAPWLLRIVSREALNLVRAEKTRFTFWRRQPQPVEEQDAETIALDSVEHQAVVRAVARLKGPDRLALTLSYFMGLNEAEIAEAMGVKRGTVKWRKHRALERLRTIVEREFPELGEAVLEPLEPEGTNR